MSFAKNVLSVVLLLVLSAGSFWFFRHSEQVAQASSDSIPATPASARSEGPATSVKSGATQEKPRPEAVARKSATVRPPVPLVFGHAGPVRLADVPEGRFKERLARLAPAARQRALQKLETLRVPLNDVGSLDVENDGALFYQCVAPVDLPAPPPVDPAVLEERNYATVAISALPARHSRLGATKVIYLDFNGHTITGTAWNNARGSVGDTDYRPAVAQYVAKPFDTDGDPATFSDSEQMLIEEIWSRVAEDYVGFDVDVTTEEPAAFIRTMGRVLITSRVDANGVSMPSSGSAGVAYLDVFGDPDYASYRSPALVYKDNVGGDYFNIADVVSHEMGHNLSLSHDGTASAEYYSGHGNGIYGWGPIMGAPYGRSFTHWSKGEYYAANNFQDDLATIQGHLGYVLDDAGDSANGAVAVTPGESSFQGRGTISAGGDADRHSFVVGTTAAFVIHGSPLRSASGVSAPNLNLGLELFDARGASVAVADSTVTTYTRSISVGLTPGTYYLRFSGAGNGLPLVNPPTGFTNYASIGEYSFLAFESEPAAPSVSSHPSALSVQAGQNAAFYVYAQGNPAPTCQWQRLPSGASEWETLAEGNTYRGVATTTLQISTLLAMDGDQFRAVLSNVAGSVTSGLAPLTVRPAVAPQIYGLPTTIAAASGGSLSISPSYSGTSPFTAVWRKDGTVIPGETGTSYYKSSVSVADAGVYTVTYTNLAGTATSTPVTVFVSPPVPPVIYNVPSNVIVAYGQSLSVSLSLSGTYPMTYQWKRNGEPLSGATNYYLSRSNSTPADSGTYTLTATNVAGTATSSGINVVVLPPVAPTISVGTPSFIVATGNSINLSPSVSGTTPMTYVWKKDGAVLSSSGSSFYISSANAASAGSYTLTVTNIAGTRESAPIVVSVNEPFAPVITGLTPIVSAKYGDSISFSPSVSGTSPITFQWKKDGVAVPNATSNYLSLQSITPANSGTYTLVATNAVGTAELSSVVTVSPAIAPLITGLPPKLLVAHGESFSLSPTIRGTTPMTYRWKKEGAFLSGASSSYFSKANVTPADSGNYTLTATNVVGSAESSPVQVEVLAALAPVIYDQPAFVSLEHGNALSINITFTGTRPCSYVWTRDEVEIASGTTSNSYSSITYYKSPATAADSGVYKVTITNIAGTATSLPIQVLVGAPIPPEITNMPANFTVNSGQSFQLSPSLKGTSPRTYVWRKDGVVLASETGSSIYRSSATVADAGAYTLTVTNLAGTATSIVSQVSVNAPQPPTIYSFTPTVAVEYGESAQLNVSVNGTSPLTYVWRKNGVIVTGGSSSSFSLNSVTEAQAGTYTLTVTNATGSATTPDITVIVGTPRAPAIHSVPATVVVGYGRQLSLNTTVTGTRSLIYSWTKDGVALADQTSSSFYKSSATPTDAGNYTLTVSNAWGTATSSSINVIVEAGLAPAVYNLPQSATRSYGDSISYYPTVTGTSPMTYQWFLNGSPVANLTSSSFYLASLTPAQSGSYHLVATNEFGTATTPSFTLTVLDAVLPTFLRQPASLTASPAASANFYAEATGSPPLAYAWYFNDVRIPDSNASSFGRTNVQAGMAGRYHVVVTNPAGSVTSQTATLTLDPGMPVATIAAGSEHSVIVRVDGSAWATGANSSGQLADGTNRTSYNFASVMSGVAAVAAGNNRTFLLKLDGTLWGVGDNSNGALGVSSLSSVPTPLQVASGVTEVAAGSGHTLFLKTDGTLWGMGNNYNGQLGGTAMNRPTPVQLASDIARIAAGGSHTLFVKTDGSLWAMGYNYSGQLGDGSTTQRTSPVQIATDVAQVAAGYQHSLFVKRDGTLWGMGENGGGQLGDGSTTDRNAPVLIDSGVAFAQTSETCSFFLKSDGSFWAMGYSHSGHLGTNGSETYTRPFQIAERVLDFRSSAQHTLFITEDGSLWGMGRSYSGQLGTGSSTSYNMPTLLIPAMPTAPRIITPPASQGALYGGPVTFSVGLLGRGAYTFQWTKDGVAIDGATARTLTIPNFTATDRGDYAVVVTNAAGSFTSTPASLALAQLPVITAPPQPRTAAIGDSVEFTVAVTSNAPVSYQWKRNDVALSGANSASLTLHSVSKADDGTYTVTVTNVAGIVVSAGAQLKVHVPPVVFAQPVDTGAVDGGPMARLYFLAYGGDDTTYLWQRRTSPNAAWTNLADGAAYSGTTTAILQILNPTAADHGHQFRCIASVPFASVTSDVATLRVGAPGHLAASAGRYHSARLDVMGGVTTAGANTFGQLGTGDTIAATTVRTISIPGETIVDLAAGGQHTLFLTADRELYAAGANATGQLGDGTTVAKSTPVKMADDVVAFSAGLFHSAYVKSDGTLWTVGGNDSSQLGDGTIVNKSTAQQIATGVVDVSAGVRQTWFLKSDGSAWAAGNFLGGETYSTVIVQIAAGVTRLSAGGYHALLLKPNGQLYGVGYNANGQLGDGTTTTTPTPVLISSNVVSMSAGYFHSAYVKDDNSLWTMGLNGSGQLGDGTTVSQSGSRQVATNVASVSAGESHTLFAKRDGTLWAMGSNSYGQFGNGATPSSLTPMQVADGVCIPPEKPAGLAVGPAASENPALSWVPSPRATSYEVWSSASNDRNSADRVAGNLRWPYFEDTTPIELARYYWVVAVNPAGMSEMSDAVSVSVSTEILLAPSIDSITPSLHTPAGASVALTVEASGTLPLSYQWYRNGEPISGQTGATLTLNPATTNHAGAYTVGVTNAVATVTSQPITLTVEKLAQTITFAPVGDRAFSAVPLVLSATASSHLSVSFELVSGFASLDGVNLTFNAAGAVTIRASQAGNDTYAAAPGVERTFLVTSNLAAWQAIYFTPEERLNSTVSGPNADPDGDGFANLLEYALGFEPRTATTANLPEVAAGATDWTYTYTRPSDRADLSYSVEVSTNLTTWAAGGVAHELVSTDPVTGAQTWRARYPLSSAANAFFRLKVALP